VELTPLAGLSLSLSLKENTYKPLTDLVLLLVLEKLQELLLFLLLLVLTLGKDIQSLMKDGPGVLHVLTPNSVLLLKMLKLLNLL
jgi:hypothetical protein